MSTACTNHPDAPGDWRCSFCKVDLCGDCVETRAIGESEVSACKECGGKCTTTRTVEQRKPLRAAAAERSWLADAFGYPVRRDGLVDLVVTFGWCTLGEVVLAMMGVSFLAGPAGLAGGAAGTGVAFAVVLFFALGVAAYLTNVLQATVAGSDESPGWPDLGRSDALSVLGLVIAAYAVSRLPEWVYLLLAEEPSTGALIVANLFGALYFPMAWLAVVVLQSGSALSPTVILPAMVRTMGGYVVCVLTWLAIAFVSVVLMAFVTGLPMLGPFLVIALNVYLMVATVRLLGLFYRRERERLGWPA